MFEWFIKKQDIIECFDNSQELCGNGTPALPPTTTPRAQICDSRLSALEANDARSKNAKSPTTSNVIQNNDCYGSDANAILQNLQSSPDTGISDCNGTSDANAILRQLRQSPSLVADASIASSIIPRKDPDEQSESATLPNSDDGDENEPRKDEKGRSKTFLFCLVLVFVLAIISIALLVAIIIRKGNLATLSNKEETTPSNDADNNNTSSTSNVFDRESNQSVEIIARNRTNYDYTANTNYLVGTYYYPWYGNDFHNGEGYLRQELVPPQQPVLGEYNDSESDVIAQHMKWFRQANIGLLVTSWWGPNRLEDSNTKNVLMKHEHIGNLKIALHYETTGRIKDNSDMSSARSDIEYMCQNYFDHPNYYKIDGRPVLFVYVTRILHSDGVLEEALLTMRSEASKCGHNLYLIGDHVFSSAPNPDDVFVPFWYFDAVTNYDVYGSQGRPEGYAGKEAVDEYYAEQEKWRDQALEENCQYIPPVSPGYNDRGVRLENDNPPLSRRLTPTSEEGSLFWYQLKLALPLTNSLVDNMVLVNSFNEWHEDTQIEPAVNVGPFDATTTQPDLLTGGLEYEGYGELYLDILGAATSKNPVDAMDFDTIYL